MSSLNRNHVRIYRSLAEADDGGYMPGTPEERLSQVWDLTQEAWSFFQGAHAEPRLQRDVAVLITNISGIEFEPAYANRKNILLEGLEIPVISVTDLIANNRASGRTQDLADVENLESASKRE